MHTSVQFTTDQDQYRVVVTDEVTHLTERRQKDNLGKTIWVEDLNCVVSEADVLGRAVWILTHRDVSVVQHDGVLVLDIGCVDVVE